MEKELNLNMRIADCLNLDTGRLNKSKPGRFVVYSRKYKHNRVLFEFEYESTCRLTQKPCVCLNFYHGLGRYALETGRFERCPSFKRGVKKYNIIGIELSEIDENKSKSIFAEKIKQI